MLDISTTGVYHLHEQQRGRQPTSCSWERTRSPMKIPKKTKRRKQFSSKKEIGIISLNNVRMMTRQETKVRVTRNTFTTIFCNYCSCDDFPPASCMSPW